MLNSKSTKHLYASTLKKLMQTKSFNKITIGELTESCGLTRNSFYYHFDDLLSLVEWMYTTAASQIFLNDAVSNNWKDVFEKSLLKLEEEKEFVLNTFHAIGYELARDFLLKNLYHIILQSIELKTAGADFSREEIEFTAAFYKNAFGGLLLDWFQAEMTPDAQSIIEIINKQDRMMLMLFHLVPPEVIPQKTYPL